MSTNIENLLLRPKNIDNLVREQKSILNLEVITD